MVDTFAQQSRFHAELPVIYGTMPFGGPPVLLSRLIFFNTKNILDEKYTRRFRRQPGKVDRGGNHRRLSGGLKSAIDPGEAWSAFVEAMV